MAVRPVFHKDLGEFFKKLRDEKDWASQRQAATIAKNRKISGINYQVLQRLESGKTKNPDPKLLRALALLYEKPYEELVATWVQHRFGGEVADLVRHGGASIIGPSEGRSDVPASAEVENRRIESRYQELVSATEEIADRLFDLAAELEAAGRSGSPVAPKPIARRRHRKTS